MHILALALVQFVFKNYTSQPRNIVKDELQECRHVLIDLQQKLAEGSARRGQETHGFRRGWREWWSKQGGHRLGG